MDVDETPKDSEEGQTESPMAQQKETDEERKERALKLKAEGNKKYSNKQYKEAIDFYSQAIDAFPQAPFYGNRAASYMAIYKFKEALSDCQSALNLDASFRKAYIRGTKCHTELAQLKEAQKFAQNGLEKFPKDNEIKKLYDRVEIIRAKLTRIDQKLSNISLKYDSFFESHLNPPTDTNTNNEMSVDKDEDQKEEKSEIWAEKIVHKLTRDDQKEIDLALSMIDSLLKNDLSQSVELKCTNIRALIIGQKYDMALSNVTSLMRWHKQNVQIMELRAIALFRNGNTDSAIKHLQQILRKDPDNKEVKKLFKYFKLMGKVKKAGNEAFKSDDFDLAILKYSELLKMDVTNHKFNCVIYSNRAAVWLKKKEWNKAYNDASIGIDLDSDYVKLYGRRIQALYGLDRYDEAVGDAERALKLDPSSNDLKRQLQEAKLELKKSKRKNYYKILGVEKDATEKEIKKGFRKMAMKWHPDRFASKSDEEKASAEQKFKEIGEAYEVLKDPKMKQRYDSGVDIDHLKSGGMPGGFPGGGVDISHIFDLLGQQGGHPFGGMGGGMPGGNSGFTFRFG